MCCTHPQCSIGEIPGLRPLQSLVSNASLLSVRGDLFDAAYLRGRPTRSTSRSVACTASTLLARAKSDPLRFSDCLDADASRAKGALLGLEETAATRRDAHFGDTRSGCIKQASEWSADNQHRAKRFERG